jgi:hypothetical protein
LGGPKAGLRGCRIIPTHSGSPAGRVAERLCQQMRHNPASMLDYLNSRGCRLGGVTLGERGLLCTTTWVPVAHFRRGPCRVIACSIPAAPATSSMAPTSIPTSPIGKIAGRAFFRLARAASAFKVPTPRQRGSLADIWRDRCSNGTSSKFRPDVPPFAPESEDGW